MGRARPVSHEEHVARVHAAHGDKLRVVGRYVHSHTKVAYECLVHGRFKALPFQITQGSGCPKCYFDSRRTTLAEHQAQVDQHRHGSIRVVALINMMTRAKYSCVIHGPFEAWPSNMKYGGGCGKCRNEATSKRTRKTHETYAQEIAPRGIEAFDRYQTAHTPIRHVCRYGHLWITKPFVVSGGHGCPYCDSSSYKRRPIVVGDRIVLIQGAEDRATALLLEEGVAPEDLAFTKHEGRPTIRYRFRGRSHGYIPDIYQKSKNLVIEVKSGWTLGLEDPATFRKNCAKAAATVAAGFSFRLMIIHRKQLIELDARWYQQSFARVRKDFRRQARVKDRRYRRA